MRYVMLGAVWLVAAVGNAFSQEQPVPPPVFEALGVPVEKGGLMGTLVGPGPEDGSERIYFNFRQEGGKLFLVQVDPATGASTQFASPAGTGAWGFTVGPDRKIYLGTHEGPEEIDNGQILVFDPREPEKQIQVVGRPSETETYLWMFTVGLDGVLYGCTYPGAKLVSYNPSTGELADLGIMDESQKYSRSIATGPDGRIYIGIGYGRANVVAYDPATGEHKSILPDVYRSHPSQTVASLYKGTDGNVYVQTTKIANAGTPEEKPEPVTLIIEGDTAREAESPATAVSRTTLSDGRVVQNVTIDGAYELLSPDGSVEKRSFTYKGSAGIFIVRNGPQGRIYGGTWMPNEMFWYDPATGESANPGNPTEVGGEIYSMLDYHGVLYICAYPGSFLSKYDPALPWAYGREAGSNPRGFGPLGPGHLRPRAMILGPDEKIYIGSYPEYGLHGGSLGVWDPVTDTLIENYHHLIKNQAIVSLVHDPQTGLVVGGSSTAGGGGTDPVEPEALLFGFDSKSKSLAFSMAPYPGAQSIRVMLLHGRRVFGIADENRLFVFDIDTKQVVHSSDLPLDTVLDLSMALWKDGKIYGLTGAREESDPALWKNAVFQLDPDIFEAKRLAEYSGNVRSGFAIDDKGIYFGDKATLMRYNWQAGG